MNAIGWVKLLFRGASYASVVAQFATVVAEQIKAADKQFPGTGRGAEKLAWVLDQLDGRIDGLIGGEVGQYVTQIRAMVSALVDLSRVVGWLK
jgi:hypothetical protein